LKSGIRDNRARGNVADFLQEKTAKNSRHVFEKFLSGLDEQAQFFDNTAITDTEIWKTLFEFQKDGVKGAVQKINAHNGCILADSVGLGKTYSALAVIK